MAAEHDVKLASIVVSYLRKHGFPKTLAAFLRENLQTIEETEVVDLESLYELFVSTQASRQSRRKKASLVKLDGGPKDFEGANNGGEENAATLSYGKINGGTVETKKAKRKKEKKEGSHAGASLNGVKLEGDIEDGKAKAKAKEKQDLKKGQSKEQLDEGMLTAEKADLKGEDFHGSGGRTKSSAEDPTANSQVGTGHGDDAQAEQTAQAEAASDKALKKQMKKQKKEEADKDLAASGSPPLEAMMSAQNTDSLPSEAGFLSKKKGKPEDGEKAEEAVLELADVASIEVTGGEKKKKGKKGLSSNNTDDTIGSLSEMISQKPEERNLVGVPASVLGSKKESGKKRKARQAPVFNETSSEDMKEVNGRLPAKAFDSRPEESNDNKALMLEGAHDSAIGSKKKSGKKKRKEGALDKNDNGEKNETEELKAAGENQNVGDDEKVVGTNEAELAKSYNKKKENPNKDKLPTGALAFKRIDVEKVSFADPRLGDNSYWAKDGAEEGYGAKAQEVLGLVKGRDFRHEKTKKKRGSYRGGLIGLQSHSIKFDNSDED